MKIQIKSTKSLLLNEVYWNVTLNNKTTSYSNYEAACIGAAKRFKRAWKEQAAWAMVQALIGWLQLLEVKEIEFIKKLMRSRCKGITKPMYGYLKGIYDRQTREW